MRENWEGKEKKLTEERDKAIQAAKYVVFMSHNVIQSSNGT
jgi:hypothetical protein